IRQLGVSGKNGQPQQRAPMTDICRYAHEGIEPQLRLNSDPPLLQTPALFDLERTWNPYHPSNIRERDAYGGGIVCIWSGISLGGRTDLQVFPRGTVNAQAYRDGILDAYVLPYSGALGDDLLLQDDESRLHIARIVDDYLQNETIQLMEWPARLPDLNPNEHFWDAL
ncbi:hypothetical protein AVEN_49773-1, partial [Araneus ventricosus]